MQYSKLDFVLFTFFFLVLTVLFAEQASAQNSVRQLALNIPIEEEIALGETRTFALHLESNQLAALRMEQKGIDLRITLTDAKGNSLQNVDRTPYEFGIERILYQSEAAPLDLVIQISPNSKIARPGKFVLTLTELKTPDAKDELRIAAQRMMVEGLKLVLKGSREDYDQALIAYDKALKIAAESGDTIVESQILVLSQTLCVLRGEHTKALDYGSRAAALLTGKENIYARTVSQYYTGFSLVNMGEPKKALEVLSEVLAQVREYGDRRLEISALINLGHANQRLGNPAQSIEYHKQADQLAESLNDQSSRSSALLAMSYNYTNQGDFLKSIELLNKALLFAKESENFINQVSIYNELGRSLNGLGRLQLALDYHLQALTVSRQAALSKFGEATAASNVGLDYGRLGQHDRALEYFQQSVKIFNALGYKDAAISSLKATSSVYISQKEFQKAREELNAALRIIETGDFPAQKAGIYETLGRVEAELGNLTIALDFYQKSIQTSREIKLKRQEVTSLSLLAKDG
jgi:tetratricopeptide (TPR) repeat protein